ncbi:hypothetical protein Pla110_04980 [Polystyrenella longa]|uniref:Uncharacterized protein n=1 Tax=Polystyrenella longa TaxID=2528007 RepID=A0A518CHZ4_9PLAN|nr:hypothetical protein [Polystyrenella longa]QDU78794.1 hypothetical protein Pla110_04980 [Polystyrenella longa]
MDFPKSMTMLKRVSIRLHLVRWAFQSFAWTLSAGIVYALLLLASRLSGYGEDVFPNGSYFSWSMAIVPVFGIIMGTILYRRPNLSDSARRVDSYYHSDDLYLTISRLDQAFGDYRPLVVQKAEQRAEEIHPTDVVPFLFGKQFAQLAGMAAVLIGLQLIPQFDPFGELQAKEAVLEQQKELQVENKATDQRKEELEKQIAPEQKRSKEVEQALNELKKTFKELQPKAPEINQKKLAEIQKPLGKMWRELNKDQLSKAFNKKMSGQRFGSSAEQAKLEEWKKELQEGSTESLRSEMENILDKMKKMAESNDSSEKSKLRKELLKQLKQVKEFAENDAQSQQLTTALKRAMKQLEMANMSKNPDGEPGENCESCEKGAMSSAELAKMELQEMEQSLEDLASLEEALKTLQQAKAKMASGEELSEEEMSMISEADALAEYAEAFAAMMEGMQGNMPGDGDGDGTGGEGTGRGGVVDEDPAAKSGFKTEFSKSKLTQGELIMSVASKDVNESGEKEAQLGSLIQDLRQGVSEAIEQEQIPPGYRDSIKKYFDTLEANDIALPGETENAPAAEPTTAPAAEPAAETTSDSE